MIDVPQFKQITIAAPWWLAEIKASHYFVSPAAQGLIMPRESINWAIREMLKQGGDWKLSTQNHKFWGIA